MFVITTYMDKDYAFGPFESRKKADTFSFRLDHAWNYPPQDCVSANKVEGLVVNDPQQALGLAVSDGYYEESK